MSKSTACKTIYRSVYFTEERGRRFVSWHVSKIKPFSPSPELTQPGEHAPRLISHFNQAFGLACSQCQSVTFLVTPLVLITVAPSQELLPPSPVSHWYSLTSLLTLNAYLRLKLQPCSWAPNGLSVTCRMVKQGDPGALSRVSDIRIGRIIVHGHQLKKPWYETDYKRTVEVRPARQKNISENYHVCLVNGGVTAIHTIR